MNIVFPIMPGAFSDHVESSGRSGSAHGKESQGIAHFYEIGPCLKKAGIAVTSAFVFLAAGSCQHEAFAAVDAGIVQVPPSSLEESEEPRHSDVTFKGGAERIVELHKYWIVNCAVDGDRRSCIANQLIIQPGANRDALSVTMQEGTDGQIKATIVIFDKPTPEAHVTLKMDEHQIGPPHAFTKCFETRCTLNYSFSRSAIDRLSTGKTLNLTLSDDIQGMTTYTILLPGLTSALRRIQYILE